MTVNNEIGVKQPITEIGQCFSFYEQVNICQMYFNLWCNYHCLVVFSFTLKGCIIIFFSSPGRICRSKGVFLHTDAAQAVGKIPINVSDWKVDLMSISGHKLYGPKG